MKKIGLFIKNIYFFFEFIVAMSLLKKEKKYTEKKNILITPLRGIENTWIDYLLAIKFSSVHNITLIMMRPSSLPFSTAEKKELFSTKIMLLLYEIKFFILVLLIRLRGVTVFIVDNKSSKCIKRSANSEHIIETAKDEFFRRYFGQRDYKNFFLYSDSKLKVDNTFYNLYDCLMSKVKETDLLWTSHAIYEWRLPYSLAKKFNKKIVVWGRNVYNSGLINISNGPMQISIRKGYFYKECQIDFNKRFNGKEIDQPTAFESNFDEELSEFLINNNNVVLLTPNCIWDGDISDRDSVFNNLYDWVKTTLEFSKANKNIAVIVRFHPAEATLWKNRPGLWNLFENYNLSDNQFFIPPKSKVSTIKLAQKSNKVIFYSGILALECLHLKIKPYCVSNSFYRNVKGVITVENKNEYFDILGNEINVNKNSSGTIDYDDIFCLGLKIIGKNKDLRSNPKFSAYSKQTEIEKYFLELLKNDK